MTNAMKKKTNLQSMRDTTKIPKTEEKPKKKNKKRQQVELRKGMTLVATSTVEESFLKMEEGEVLTITAKYEHMWEDVCEIKLKEEKKLKLYAEAIIKIVEKGHLNYAN